MWTFKNGLQVTSKCESLSMSFTEVNTKQPKTVFLFSMRFCRQWTDQQQFVQLKLVFNELCSFRSNNWETKLCKMQNLCHKHVHGSIGDTIVGHKTCCMFENLHKFHRVSTVKSTIHFHSGAKHSSPLTKANFSCLIHHKSHHNHHPFTAFSWHTGISHLVKKFHR